MRKMQHGNEVDERPFLRPSHRLYLASPVLVSPLSSRPPSPLPQVGENRLLVTRFVKGDYIMRKGEAATFLAILLQVPHVQVATVPHGAFLTSSLTSLHLPQGELGVRIGKGAGFPRRLHKGALFGERGMFNAGNLRAADVIALYAAHARATARCCRC